MDNITQITDHVDAAGKRLLTQFWTLQAEDYCDVIYGQYQELEDVLFPMIAAKYLSAATGYTLAQIGTLVGYTRPTTGSLSTSDILYRAIVYGQIAANISYGTKQDIYDIMGALSTTGIQVFNLFPRSIEVNYIGSSVVSGCACIQSILESATHPIEIDLVEYTETPLGFLGDASASGLGIGEIAKAG